MTHSGTFVGLSGKPNPYSFGSGRFSWILGLSFVLMFGGFVSVIVLGSVKAPEGAAAAALLITIIGVNLPVLGAELDLLWGQEGPLSREKAQLVRIGIIFSLGVISFDAFLAFAGAKGPLHFDWLIYAVGLVFVNVIVLMALSAKRKGS